MLQQNRLFRYDSALRVSVACVVLYLFGRLLDLGLYANFGNIHKLLIHILMFIPIILCPVLLKRNHPAEACILSVYALWVVVSKTLLGSVAQEFHSTVEYALSSCAIFVTGLSISRENRDRFLTFFTAVFGIFLALLWAGTLYILLTGIVTLDLWGFRISGGEGYGCWDVTIFNTHRNLTVPWFQLEAGLLVWRWSKTDKRWEKALLALGLIMIYFFVSISHSRTSEISFAFGAGLLVMFLIYRFRKVSRRIAFPISAVAGALVFLLFFQSYSWNDALFSKIFPAPAPVEGAQVQENTEAGGTESIAESVAENAMENAVVETEGSAQTAAEIGGFQTDDRDFWTHAATLTGRTEIWKKGFQKLSQHPSILLTGQRRYGYMEGVEGLWYPDIVHPHMHNMVLQYLMLDGLPGMLLFLAFLLLLVRAILCLFFCPIGSLSDQLLSIPLASLLVVGIAEPLFSNFSDSISTLYLLIAGVAIAIYYDARKQR